MSLKRSSDDGNLSLHTGAMPMGRVRPATLDEADKRETMFRPEAVLALTTALPADIGPFEAHVAGFIDGMRPVARIRSKSGVSSADLRIALAQLCDRHLLRLAGLVEEVAVKVAGDPPHDDTMTRAAPDRVPVHVMAEIQSMIDEDEPT